MAVLTFRLAGASAWRWAHGAAASTWAVTSFTRPVAIAVEIGWCAVLAEGVEAITERHHQVSGERVVSRVVDIVGCDVSADIGFLAEYVVGSQSDCGRTAAEELIGNRGIPHPCLGVVAGRVTRSGVIVEVGAEHDAYRSIVGGVERAAVSVYGAVGTFLHGVGHRLEVVVRA